MNPGRSTRDPRPREEVSRPAAAVVGRHGLGECLAALLLGALFVVLALSHAASTSPTFDEPAHLVAGYSYWRWHDYRINPEHPPLLKRWTTLPLLWMDAWPDSLDPRRPAATLGNATRTGTEIRRAWELSARRTDAEWLFAHAMLYGMTDEALTRLGASSTLQVDPRADVRRSDFLVDADRLLLPARAANLVLGVALGGLIFAWARRLYGAGAGLLALALYSLDPNFIAHAALVTTDVGLSLFFAASVYFLWLDFRRPGATTAGGLTACCALAIAAKFTALLLAPILLLVGLLAVLAPAEGDRGRSAARRTLRRAGPWRLGALLSGAAIASWFLLWAVYGFRFPAIAQPGGPLPLANVIERTALVRSSIDAALVESVEAEPAAVPDLPGRLILRAARAHLLPEGYLYGLAHARLKSQARASFLRGERSLVGERSYFLWTFALKTPLATLAIMAAGLIASLRRWRLRKTDLIFLLLPAAVYLAIATGSRLNIGHRHLLPIYPFLYVLAGGLVSPAAASVTRGRQKLLALLVAAVAISSSFVFAPPWRPTRIYPSFLAFFNELAGGPARGYRSLVDSNLDWGQDLRNLKPWLQARGIESPIGLCYFGTADPRFYSLAHVKLPGGYDFEPPFGRRASFAAATAVDHVAISATHLQGVYLEAELREGWRRLLRGAEPIGSVGHSIFVYRLPPAAED